LDLNRKAELPSPLVSFYICLFLLGWVTQEFALLNVGKYSILLVYLAALPFCWRMTGRSLVFVLLPLISTIMSALISLFGGGVHTVGIVSQGALQLLAIFFAAGVATLNWRTYFATLTKATVIFGAPIVIFGGYQMVARARHMKYAFLPVTNQQAYAIGDLQRGWEKEYFTRASSIFVEPAEFGYFCLWLMVLGLSASKGRWRLCSLALALGGMLFSQSLSGVLGAAILFAVYLVLNPISVKVVRQGAIVVLVSIMAIFASQPLMPEAFEAFSKRIEQAATLDNRADSGRVDHLPANWEQFKEAPIWGHGFASVSSADDNGIDVTTFTYFLMLIERGLIGAIFFLVPWFWLTWRSVKLPRTDSMRTLCVLLSVLHLYTFWTSSVAYQLPYWLSLGICASCTLYTYMPSSHLAFTGWTNWRTWSRPEES